ncbi:MAG: 30S ribosomal protein S13 [Candidatus Paceibacterota bacterium]
MCFAQTLATNSAKDKMRIAGITLPEQKRLEFALTSVYGIGRSKARALLLEASIESTKKPSELTADEEVKIRTAVENEKIEGELKREVSGNIKRLKDIAAYRGSRHSKRLPVRGQRTKTNARTLKGSKKTMGSGKKKVEKK